MIKRGKRGNIDEDFFFIDLIWTLYLLLCCCDMGLGGTCYTQPWRLCSPRISRLCVRLRLFRFGLK